MLTYQQLGYLCAKQVTLSLHAELVSAPFVKKVPNQVWGEEESPDTIVRHSG